MSAIGNVVLFSSKQQITSLLLDAFQHFGVSAELQKRADRADQSVLFFLAGANFWEKHAKTGEKQALFWC